MILLLLTTLALASDVYEICVLENQVWSDQNQTWKTELVTTYYSFDTIQLIIHKNSFEVNRKERKIKYRHEMRDKPCFFEHDNSFICFDKQKNQFLWESYQRNGRVTRDVMQVCRKNGE